MNPRLLRAGLVFLLLGGAYFAALPWTSCAFPLGLRGGAPDLLRICAFGTGNAAFDRQGPGPLWPYLVVAGIYVLAALAVTLTRRIGFSTATRT
jgi:hypothetical protein